jgi:hypothetical protein
VLPGLLRGWVIIVFVPPEPGVAPVMPPVTVPIVHTYVLLGKLVLNGILVVSPLHIVYASGVVITGLGSIPTIIVYGSPAQEFAVGVIIYSTDPVVVWLGLVRICWIAGLGPEADPAAAPVMPPVILPIVHVNVLGTVAVKGTFVETPLQKPISEEVTLGLGVTVTFIIFE